jgi:hypothetical protein
MMMIFRLMLIILLNMGLMSIYLNVTNLAITFTIFTFIYIFILGLVEVTYNFLYNFTIPTMITKKCFLLILLIMCDIIYILETISISMSIKIVILKIIRIKWLLY